MSRLQHRFGDGQLGRRIVEHAVHHFVVENAFPFGIGQPQPFGHQTDRRTLHDQRQQRHEKDDIEQQARILHAGHDGIGGENDRHGAAQPHPRNVEAGAGGEFAERQQREEDRGGTCDEDHEQTRQAAQQQHLGLQQFVNIDQQSQRDEKDHLKQPREAVEKRSERLLVNDRIVPHNQSRDIDGQIAVAADQVGHREGQEDERQQQYGVERLVFDIDPVDRPDGQTAERIPCHDAERHPHHEEQQARTEAHAFARRQQPDQQNGQNIGHRVVTAAFELQQRFQILAQPLPAAAQDREDRRRVGRRHGGGKEQRQQERHLGIAPRRHHVDEPRHDQRRQRHTDGGQHHAGPDHGANGAVTGVHTARKKNDTQRHHAHELSHGSRIEGDEPQPEQHADAEKQQQGRSAETVGHFSGKDGNQQQQRPDQNDILSG